MSVLKLVWSNTDKKQSRKKYWANLRLVKKPKPRYQISESTRMQREFMADALAVQEDLRRRRNG